MEDIKQFFLPGDMVTIRQNLPNKPTMLVVKKITKTINIGGIKNDFFQGILCRWFTTEGLLQEAPFNTKDLIKV
jgi:hypothetical protein